MSLKPETNKQTNKPSLERGLVTNNSIMWQEVLGYVASLTVFVFTQPLYNEQDLIQNHILSGVQNFSSGLI